MNDTIFGLTDFGHLLNHQIQSLSMSSSGQIQGPD